jgi:hypothetical protein
MAAHLEMAVTLALELAQALAGAFGFETYLDYGRL